MKRSEEILQEKIGVIHPVEDICCIGCIFVNKDNPFENDPHKGCCGMYPNESGKMKPDSILFEGAKCKYYREVAGV